MQRMQLMALAEGLAAGNQRRVIFHAGQLLAGLQQAATQMPFARAPIQPVPGSIGKLQAAGEGFDLLPLAARHVDIQSMARLGQCMGGQFIHVSQCNGQFCQ
ncbi:hypothetical protein D3C85_1452410 [compost metagenome]